MLEVARRRLGDSIQLDLGDATNMPYEDRKFDLVISMLTIHEMSQKTRSGVVSEMQRVLKDDGHILLIDYHPGPYQPIQGWISKLIIYFAELAAGLEHFKNYRQFMAMKGLATLITLHNLDVRKKNILA